MGVKSFFMPTVQKLLFSAALVITTFLVLIAPPLSFVFQFSSVLLFSFPLFVTLPFFGVFVYSWGCTIAYFKRVLLGFLIFVLAIFIISVIVFAGVTSFNNTAGKVCSENNECRFVCPDGAVNALFFPLHKPLVIAECFEVPDVLCTRNKCVIREPLLQP